MGLGTLGERAGQYAECVACCQADKQAARQAREQSRQDARDARDNKAKKMLPPQKGVDWEQTSWSAGVGAASGMAALGVMRGVAVKIGLKLPVGRLIAAGAAIGAAAGLILNGCHAKCMIGYTCGGAGDERDVGVTDGDLEVWLGGSWS